MGTGVYAQRHPKGFGAGSGLRVRGFDRAYLDLKSGICGASEETSAVEEAQRMRGSC